MYPQVDRYQRNGAGPAQARNAGPAAMSRPGKMSVDPPPRRGRTGRGERLRREVAHVGRRHQVAALVERALAQARASRRRRGRPRTAPPASSAAPPVPWSVPPVPFSRAVRPNSVIARTSVGPRPGRGVAKLGDRAGEPRAARRSAFALADVGVPAADREGGDPRLGGQALAAKRAIGRRRPPAVRRRAIERAQSLGRLGRARNSGSPA